MSPGAARLPYEGRECWTIRESKTSPRDVLRHAGRIGGRIFGQACVPQPWGLYRARAQRSDLPLPGPPFPHSLACVTGRAPGRAIRYVVPLASLTDRHDVVCVHVSPIGHTAAVNALPMASIQYSLTPLLMSLVAIATGCRVGPVALVSPRA